MTGSLREPCPGLKSKRSREQSPALARPPGRKGYALTAGLRTGTRPPTVWLTSATSRLGARIPSVPIPKPCVTPGLPETAVPYNRGSSRPRNICPGLLEGEEATACHRGGRRTRRDLRHPTRQASLRATARTTAWSAGRLSV